MRKNRKREEKQRVRERAPNGGKFSILCDMLFCSNISLFKNLGWYKKCSDNSYLFLNDFTKSGGDGREEGKDSRKEEKCFGETSRDL